MKFLIESSVETLVKIFACLFETLLSHLCGASVLSPGDIRPHRGHLSERKVHSGCPKDHQSQQNPEEHRPDKERPRTGKIRFACEYEPDVISKALHILSLDSGRDHCGWNGITSLSLGHFDVQRIGLESHILAGIDIIV